MFRSAAALCATLALALPANAFMARNSLVVEPRADGTFEVPYRGLSGASDFWCAAGDYVFRELGLPPETRIFRVSGPPRRSGQGITFSLSPEGATKTGLFILGDNRSVSAAHARQLCEVKTLIAD
ncbi:MAG: hypothetical protein RIE24_16645 [Silicimonas sp.]